MNRDQVGENQGASPINWLMMLMRQQQAQLSAEAGVGQTSWPAESNANCLPEESWTELLLIHSQLCAKHSGHNRCSINMSVLLPLPP